MANILISKFRRKCFQFFSVFLLILFFGCSSVENLKDIEDRRDGKSENNWKNEEKNVVTNEVVSGLERVHRTVQEKVQHVQKRSGEQEEQQETHFGVVEERKATVNKREEREERRRKKREKREKREKSSDAQGERHSNNDGSGKIIISNMVTKKNDDINNKYNANSNYTNNNNNNNNNIKTRKTGLLIIPGLGRTDRLSVIMHNLQLLINGNYIMKKELSRGFDNYVEDGSNKNDKSNNNYNNSNNKHNNYLDKLNRISNEKKSDGKTENGTETETEIRKYENTWDCVIYIYADKRNSNNTDFWNKKEELDFLASYCDLVENPNKMVTENLHMVKPETLEFSYNYVFILLDDCKLMVNQKAEKNGKNEKNVNNAKNNFFDGADKGMKNYVTNGVENDVKDSVRDTFDLSKMLRIMKSNGLTVASPQVKKLKTVKKKLKINKKKLLK